MSVLKVSDLTVGYNGVPILSDLNFEIDSGKILSVVGSNGSGKSTLVKTLAQKIPPISGTLEWSVERVHIRYLPQSVQTNPLFSLTAKEILESNNIDIDHLKIFSSNDLNKRWNDLSGGEQQRLLIEIKLKTDGVFLILDEPFNHLDSTSIERLLQEILTLIYAKRLLGAIIVSHFDLRQANTGSKIHDLLEVFHV